MGMILRIASSRIVGQGDIVGRSGYFSLNLSANSVMRGRLDARRTLKSLVAELRFNLSKDKNTRKSYITELFVLNLLRIFYKRDGDFLHKVESFEAEKIIYCK